MKKNKNGFSVIIAMGLVLITTLLAFTILEFIIPFSRDIKGIENSTKAYYQANNGIELGLYHFSTRGDSSLREEDGKNYINNTYDFMYRTYSSGTIVPLLGRGNSNIDNSWNTISITDPIQLIIGFSFVDDSNVDELSIDFRVPDFDSDGLFLQTLDGGVNTPIINWQLLSDDDTLNSLNNSVDIFTAPIINGGSVTLNTLTGKKVSDGVNQTFGNFFTANNCDNVSNKCILKFSIVNNITSGGTIIPFIEWRLNAGTNIIPLRYSNIESSGKSYGFTKSLEIKVPQETVSQAFDFTVFQ
ncbi:hypothetical protein HUU51_04075 [Candidatus Gracilibacteria bacterium]|nr:hypothetical protein [Candidatus Gracilibacteria bacterium]